MQQQLKLFACGLFCNAEPRLHNASQSPAFVTRAVGKGLDKQRACTPNLPATLVGLFTSRGF